MAAEVEAEYAFPFPCVPAPKQLHQVVAPIIYSLADLHGDLEQTVKVNLIPHTRENRKIVLLQLENVQKCKKQKVKVVRNG